MPEKRKVNLLLTNDLSAGLLVYIFQNKFSITQLKFLGACRKQKRIHQNSSKNTFKNLIMKLFLFLVKIYLSKSKFEVKGEYKFTIFY